MNSQADFVTGPPSKSLAVSRRVLRSLVIVNLVYGALILALLIASLVAEEAVFAGLGVHPADATVNLVRGMRLIMLAGIASAAIAHVILTQLLAIVDTVRAGDPFISENAGRLRKIAWAVLGFELLYHATGAIAAGVSSQSQPLDIGWSFSLTRWIAVLLLFVLAGVFDQGARMRADLEGTV